MKTFMTKAFWPLISAIFTVTVLFFWFSAKDTGEELIEKTELAIEQQMKLPPDCSYEINGRNVILHGFVEDETERKRIIAAVKAIPGIGDVQSNLILLPQRTRISLCLDIDDDSVTLSGVIPYNMDRDALMRTLEEKKPGLAIYDDLTTVTGDFPNFPDHVDYLLRFVAQINQGRVALSGADILFDSADVANPDKLDIAPGMTVGPMGKNWDNAKCASISD